MPSDKVSKNGWPIGISDFDIGVCYGAEAERLMEKLKVRYNLKNIRYEQFPLDPHMGRLLVTARMSMETFGILKAFINGWAANR